LVRKHTNCLNIYHCYDLCIFCWLVNSCGMYSDFTCTTWSLIS